METKLNKNCTPGGEPAKPGNPLSAETGPTDSGGEAAINRSYNGNHRKFEKEHGQWKIWRQHVTRAQAEAKYTKLLGDTQTHLEALEAAVQAASNTKMDIKNGIRALGICFREFQNSARMIGMTRNPDATEQRVRNLQQHRQHQQQIQHTQTMKLINTIREEQL